MTKAQYELLENFGLHRIEDDRINIEDLRQAARDAVLVIPYRSVTGMENMADPAPAETLAGFLIYSGGTCLDPVETQSDHD